MGKISAQPHTSLCIQFLNRENNDYNNTLPLGKQICFIIAWGCAEILPTCVLLKSSEITNMIYFFVLGGHYPLILDVDVDEKEKMFAVISSLEHFTI